MAVSRQLISIKQAQAPFFVGIDLGGTNIKLGVVDDLGRTLAYDTTATHVELGAEDAVRRMADAVRQLLAKAAVPVATVGKICLASPGTMDLAAGMLLLPANLHGWDYFPIRDRLSHYCGQPVAFANDATAAAFGEHWVGSGRDFHSMVLLTLGTGLGCGIIIGDLPVSGEHSHGGEFGHSIIDCRDDARVCGCGRRGHLEAYASATALIKRTQQLLAAGHPTSLRRRLDAGEEFTPKLLAEEAEGGDEFSKQIILQTAGYLAVGIVNLMHTLNPHGILLGGAMTFGGSETEVGRRFLARIREEVWLRAYKVPAEKTVIELAALGSDAGYIGAAGIARREYRREKSPQTAC